MPIETPLRMYNWGQLLSRRSIVSSPAWAIENWNKPLVPAERFSIVYPIRLVATLDLSVVETNGRDIGSYVAISHTWGSHRVDASQRDISAGAQYRNSPGNEVKMKEIQAAVKKLGAEYFWMDTICINQADMEEKSEEVKKMGHYYRNASCCLVHLDDLAANDTLPHVYAAFKSFLDATPSGTSALAHMMAGMSDVRVFMSATFLVNALVDTLWGTRVWTIQEALLHPVLEFMIPGLPDLLSSHVVENALFLKAISSALALSNQRGTLAAALGYNIPAGLSTNVYLPIGEQVVNEGRSNVAQVILMRRKDSFVVANLLDVVRTRECTLSQDRVYGILGLLPYGSDIKVDYSVDLNAAMKELFTVALAHDDTSILYFTGGSRGMIPDIQRSQTSLVPGYTFPIVRMGDSISAMTVEYVGEIVESVQVRDNITNVSDQEKFDRTLTALYQVLDLMRERRIPEEDAVHIVCLGTPWDNGKASFLAHAERTRDTPEEEAAMRGLSLLYGECKMQLARVVSEGRPDRWVGVSSDEDVVGSVVVCMGITSWEDRVGMVVTPLAGPVVRRIGATVTIQKDEYPMCAILVPDEL